MNAELDIARLRNCFDVRSCVAEGGFLLHVNYDLPVSRLLAAGHYHWMEQEINQKNFPSEARGESDLEVTLISFGRAMKSGEVATALGDEHIRPATLPELLTFGATYPDRQLEFPIVGLGSIWKDRNGKSRVPYLSNDPDQNRQCLLWEYETWFGIFRFAAVRGEEPTHKIAPATAEVQRAGPASCATSCCAVE